MDVYILDTNIIGIRILSAINIALTAQEEAMFHFAGRLFLSSVRVPIYTLCEAEILMRKVFPKKYRLEAKAIKAARTSFRVQYSTIRNFKLIHLPSNEELDDAWGMYCNTECRNGQYLSYFDCCLLAAAKKTGFSILSLDKRLVNYAIKNNIPCKTGQELI